MSNNQLMTLYQSLPEDGKQEVIDFILFLANKESQKTVKPAENSVADNIFAAMDAAAVNVPVTWTREEINERS
ncbi:MAG: DUF2281 domain-containing protein [Eubacterium sp.]|nr:DUF2281 domain-containing protein [Eubacterium sp.]